MIHIEHYKNYCRVTNHEKSASYTVANEQEAMEVAYSLGWLRRPVPIEPWVWKPPVIKTTKDLEIEIYE